MKIESNGKYEVIIGYVECSEDEIRSREDKIISVLMDNAIRLEREKARERFKKEKCLTQA